METIKPGANTPDFRLKDQNEKEVELSALAGKNILLSFHPLAWTSICADQMLSLEKHNETFNNLNTVPLGISVDSVPCKSAWARELGIKYTRLLCDFWPHGEVAIAFGIFREKNGFSERANIIIDENSKIVFVKIYPIRELPDIAEILAVLQKR